MDDGIRSVLFLCLPGIGDSLFAVPALRALRSAKPDVRITAVTMFSGASELLRLYPEIDEVIQWDFLAAGTLRSLRFVLGLRCHGYDACVVAYPGNRAEYNAIAWLTGAKVRLGHRYAHRDLRCANWLNTHTVRELDELTNVEENLRLVELLVGKRLVAEKPHIPLDDEALAWAQRWIADRGLVGQVIVGFHPGGSTHKNHIHKRWPPRCFSDLGRTLADEMGARILLFGGTDEEPLKQEIADRIGGAALVVSSPNLPSTCALAARCDHFVANDNALLHLARALDVPATGIFGPTSAAWVRLPRVECREVSLNMMCQPCFYYSPRHLQCRSRRFGCLADLSADIVATEVINAVQTRLGRKAVS